MSERDPLYNPVELLKITTAAETETAEEWSALYEFLKVLKEWENEKKSKEDDIKFSIANPGNPLIHKQIQERSEKIQRLQNQMWELSRSEVLEPVVWRVYERERAREVEEFRREQEAAFQRKLQKISDNYEESRRKRLEEEHGQQADPIQQADPVSDPPISSKDTQQHIRGCKVVDLWDRISPILLLVGIPIALYIILGWNEIPKVISALSDLGGGSWFFGTLLVLFAGIGVLNICVGICLTIEKIGEKSGKKSLLWSQIYLIATLFGLIALFLIIK